MSEQPKRRAPGKTVWVPFYTQKNRGPLVVATSTRPMIGGLAHKRLLLEMLGGMAVLIAVIFWSQGYF